VNRLLLSARLQERGATRYTPAGLPALDLMLEHRSEVTQSGQRRQVSLEMKALAIGDIAATLAALPLGSTARFAGFVAGARNGRGCLFHVTEFEAEEAAPVAL
jgi:primosomal replication protein N